MSSSPPEIFDRRLVRRRRLRATPESADYTFLADRAARDGLERLALLDREFPLALDLAARGGVFRRALHADEVMRGRIGTLIEADLAGADAMVQADEEALPFARDCADLVVSLLSLHLVNDVPGALLQIRQILKPEGVFFGALFGGDTLRELRSCLAEAEIEEDGGLSPRIAPFADIRDAAALLQRAGFDNPVVDSDGITVTYGSPMELLRDLRGMGETNTMRLRKRAFLKRGTLARACALYADRYDTGGGRVSATFEILYLTGFAPPSRP